MGITILEKVWSLSPPLRNLFLSREKPINKTKNILRLKSETLVLPASREKWLLVMRDTVERIVAFIKIPRIACRIDWPIMVHVSAVWEELVQPLFDHPTCTLWSATLKSAKVMVMFLNRCKRPGMHKNGDLCLSLCNCVGIVGIFTILTCKIQKQKFETLLLLVSWLCRKRSIHYVYYVPICFVACNSDRYWYTEWRCVALKFSRLWGFELHNRGLCSNSGRFLNWTRVCRNLIFWLISEWIVLLRHFLFFR